MSTKTEKYGFNTWLETDPVDFEEINENFRALDGYNLCIESGTVTSQYSGGTASTATWHYKKYADKTIEMSTKIEFDNLRCNGGDSSPYYSESSKLHFPFELSKVYDVQMHLASNTIGWVSNITGKSVIDYVLFRVMGTAYESTEIFKQIFINVKGVYK